MNRIVIIAVLLPSLFFAPGLTWPFFLMASQASAQEATETAKMEYLAVLDFEAKGGISKDEASIITERFRAQLLDTGHYKIMERAKMQEILKEQGFQQSGFCDNTECSVEIGRLLSVNRILTGSVSKFGGMYTLSARIMDVEKGNILVEKYQDCKCPLEDLLTDATAALVAKLTGYQVGPSPISTPKPTPQPTPMPSPVPTPKPTPSPLAPATLAIQSEPSGAEVFWQGKAMGKTPLSLQDQKPGTYSLKLVLEGYQETEQEIMLKAGPNMLNVPLKKMEEGDNAWIWGVVIGTVVLVAGGVIFFLVPKGPSPNVNAPQCVGSCGTTPIQPTNTSTSEGEVILTW